MSCFIRLSFVSVLQYPRLSSFTFLPSRQSCFEVYLFCNWCWLLLYDITFSASIFNPIQNSSDLFVQHLFSSTILEPIQSSSDIFLDTQIIFLWILPLFANFYFIYSLFNIITFFRPILNYSLSNMSPSPTNLLIPLYNFLQLEAENLTNRSSRDGAWFAGSVLSQWCFSWGSAEVRRCRHAI